MCGFNLLSIFFFFFYGKNIIILNKISNGSLDTNNCILAWFNAHILCVGINTKVCYLNNSNLISSFKFFNNYKARYKALIRHNTFLIKVLFSRTKLAML